MRLGISIVEVICEIMDNYM